MLVDALDRIVTAARAGGGQLIVVDAMDEQAHAFYRRHDIIAVEGTMRLYLKVATPQAALEVQGVSDGSAPPGFGRHDP